MKEVGENTAMTGALRPRALKVRQWLLLASGALVLFVSGFMLAASWFANARMARAQAEGLIKASTEETRSRLRLLFNPVNETLIERCASVSLGGFLTDDPKEIKDHLSTPMHALEHVSSLMMADLDGWQFLVLRDDRRLREAPLLKGIAPKLPPLKEEPRQYVTREFSVKERGRLSRWTLWSEDGSKPVISWTQPMPDYDPRNRPWFRAGLRSAELRKASKKTTPIVVWTPVNELYTTKTPGISAAAAAVDPKGRTRIVAFDLKLEDLMEYAVNASPSSHGYTLILTDDGRLLGPPRSSAEAAPRKFGMDEVRPVAECGVPSVVASCEAWRTLYGGSGGQFRLKIGGAPWWTGFSRFDLGDGSGFWVGVIIPESDLVPMAARTRVYLLAICGLCLVLASAFAFLLARLFSRPLVELVARSRAIATLDLRKKPDVSSKIREVGELSEAVEEMRVALRTHVFERDKVLLELKDREKELRALVENSTDLILRLDRDLRLVYANSACEKATGTAVEQTIGRLFDELNFPEELFGKVAEHARLAFEELRGSSFQFHLSTPRGVRHFECRVTPEVGARGLVEAVLLVSRDITDRMHAEEALRRSEARYRLLIESPLGGFVVWNSAEVLFANQAAARLFGFEKASQMTALPFPFELLEDRSRELLLELSAKALRGEPIPVICEWGLVRPDGSRRWLQARLMRIDWENGAAIQAFLSDATDTRVAESRQAELEAQLLQAQKMEAVGQLAGGIAHDLNNLLQVIGGNASLASMQEVSARDRESYIAEVTRATERASLMLKQLLAFSRRQPLQRKPIELNALASSHLNLIRRLLPENISVRFEPSAGDLVVDADPTQLEQVLMNLCVNARDAMPSGGTLVVNLQEVNFRPLGKQNLLEDFGSYARLSVADTGVGMDGPTAKRVFEPFYTTKGRDRGTGLGLAVVYGIVQQHGGQIEVRSQPGKGAEFVIHLPLVRVSPEPVAPPENRSEKKGSGVILLAEDSEPVLELARKILARAGYDVLVAKDGQEAVECFERNASRIDLLFFDVMMPHLNGFQAAAQCRKRRPDVALLFSSGYAPETVKEQSSAFPEARLLSKPFDPNVLLATVRECLSCK